jgi:hypothetical protein
MKRTFIDSVPIGAGWAALEYMWIVEYMEFHIFSAEWGKPFVGRAPGKSNPPQALSFS